MAKKQKNESPKVDCDLWIKIHIEYKGDLINQIHGFVRGKGLLDRNNSECMVGPKSLALGNSELTIMILKKNFEKFEKIFKKEFKINLVMPEN